jgi:hypothetical protein
MPNSIFELSGGLCLLATLSFNSCTRSSISRFFIGRLLKVLTKHGQLFRRRRKCWRIVGHENILVLIFRLVARPKRDHTRTLVYCTLDCRARSSGRPCQGAKRSSVVYPSPPTCQVLAQNAVFYYPCRGFVEPRSAMLCGTSRWPTFNVANECADASGFNSCYSQALSSAMSCYQRICQGRGTCNDKKRLHLVQSRLRHRLQLNFINVLAGCNQGFLDGS